MRYLCYTLGDESIPLPPPTQEQMDEMGKFVGEAITAGVIVATGGLTPTSEGFRVAYDGKDYTITDGPFAEAKELIGGWARMDVASKDDILYWTKRFLALVGGGETTIRRVYADDEVPGA